MINWFSGELVLDINADFFQPVHSLFNNDWISGKLNFDPALLAAYLSAEYIDRQIKTPDELVDDWHAQQRRGVDKSHDLV
jgi:hypothetical protein